MKNIINNLCLDINGKKPLHTPCQSDFSRNGIYTFNNIYSFHVATAVLATVTLSMTYLIAGTPTYLPTVRACCGAEWLIGLIFLVSEKFNNIYISYDLHINQENKLYVTEQEKSIVVAGRKGYSRNNVARKYYPTIEPHFAISNVHKFPWHMIFTFSMTSTHFF